ncbi:MAG: bacillithiol biosynthesis cysteine-adding enzyme BshC [Bacteroidota bacterium]|nr:bacillithiol biosynthesis cysteine-adding enzyme BshC [Bacteroidota bacterium]
MQFNLSEIDFLSSATKAFVDGQTELKNLIGEQHPFYNIDEAINGKSDFSVQHRQILVDELLHFYKNQLQDSVISEKVINNISALKNKNTYTITTGQQLHPCLGPALVLYKIIDVIVAAEIFNKKYPDCLFVPIFWMASEDHDYDEVKTIKIYNKEFTWQTNQSGALGRYHTKDFALFFDELISKVNFNEQALVLVSQIKDCYLSSSNLSQATAKIVNHLFGEKGLVVLEADNKNFKSLFTKVMIDDITQNNTNHSFQNFSEKIKTQNLSLQLNSRAINFFYLTDKDRKRIVYEDKKYKVLETDIEYSETEILELINHFPEKFSPNAVLRPLYQETILPNVSYIGGNAEINYWLQLKEVFEAHHLNPPHLKLRSSYWIMNQTQSNWLKENKINPIELLKSIDKQDRYKLINLPESEYLTFLIQFSELKTQILDYTSKVKLNELHAISEKSKEFEKLLKKVNTAFEEKSIKENEFIINKLDKIYFQTFDLNNIQERHQTVLELYINCNAIVDFLSNIHAKFINNAQIIKL